MRPARRRPGPWVGMVSLLAPTDRGGWEVRSREPSLWGPFLPPAASWCVSGAAVPETGFQGPSSLPALFASARRPRPPGSRLLRPRAPSRHLGVPGRKKHGSLPGTMHARTSTPPPAGAGSRAVPPRALRQPPPPPKSSAGLCWVRVHLSLSRHCNSASETLTHLTCYLFFSGIDYWPFPNHMKLEQS